MNIALEDLLRIREIAAEKGSEFTPQEVINILCAIRSDIKIVKKPGLVTKLRELRGDDGNNGTSGSTGSS